MSAVRRRVLVLGAAALTVATGLLASGPLRDACLFPLLGVFPGVALAGALPLERGALPRWALGVAASPLVTALVAWGLMRAGLALPLAARTVAVAGAAAWALTEWRAARAPRRSGGRDGAWVAWAWALGGAAVVGAVLFSNPWLRVRGDAWVHAGIVWEILERGIPPQDPRFAGLALNYVWFHNYVVALLASLGQGDPFSEMALADVGSMFATLSLAWLLGRQVWRSRAAAAGTVALVALGFNAVLAVLWPLQLVRALRHAHGPGAIRAALASAHWNDVRVLFELTPPRSYMANFLDKPLHGTAINVAYEFLFAYLWAVVRTLRGQRGAGMAWTALAAAGMLFFHGVVGMSAIPVMLGALALAWLLAWRWTWLPARRRLVRAAVATLAGVLLATPYSIAISRAWPAARSGLHHAYFTIDGDMSRTLATSLVLGAWFARRALPRLAREGRGTAAVVALYTLGMLAFACLVTLPLGSHVKFAFEVFAGIEVLGGRGFHDELAAWRARLGPAGAAALVAVLLVATPALTLRGFVLDRSGRTAPELHLPPGEAAMYAWMRDSTDASAVFLDDGYRNLVSVHARRQLLLGSPKGPELAAFPLAETLRRRAVMADVYGPCGSLERDVALLRGLGRPALVIVRAADEATRPSPAPRLDARPELFRRAYDRDGFIVYHVLGTGAFPPPRSETPR